MRIAIDKGMRLITHLYFCTSTVTRDHGFRSLGVIESAFLRDELFVEIIAEGKLDTEPLITHTYPLSQIDEAHLCNKH
jgi:N-acetylglucosamine-6-phosphate deacetylase